MTKMNRGVLTGGATALVCLFGARAMAADYFYDSVAGDDAKDGLTEAAAKKTLKAPSGTGHTLHVKRGSSWSMNISFNNTTVTTYGAGDRPAIIGTITVTKSVVEGLAAKPPKGLTKAVNGINVMSDSTLRDCEVDGGGTAEYMLNVGIGVMGTNNHIISNYVHDLAWSASGGEMDNSGGAEGIMVMASNNEIAFNSAVRCQSANSTLGGYEGGCFEIVNGKALSTISNVSFHHNYCERSVGMWEGCSGDFSASGGGIQENHGIIENVTVSYNLSVDSMWIYLLQPVNTDFRNVVFANNTIIHTAKSKEYWDNSSFHYCMANAVGRYTNNTSGITYDTDNQYYKKDGGFQPGTVIVKNNIFMDDVGATRYQMFLTNLTDHGNNLFIPSNASVGSITLAATEKKVNVADLAFTADYRLTANSTPALNVGANVGMTGNGALAVSALDPAFFPDVFTQDIDRHAVPCGAGVDIGASEYCAEAGGSAGTGGAVGTGGSASTGGAAVASSAGGKTNGGSSAASGAGSANTSTKVIASGGSTSGGKTGSASTSNAPGGNTSLANVGGNTNSSSGSISSQGGNSAGTATNASGISVSGGAVNSNSVTGQTSAAAAGGTANAASSNAASSATPSTTSAGGSVPSTTAVGSAGDVDGDDCGCRMMGAHRNGLASVLFGLGLLAFKRTRRRR